MGCPHVQEAIEEPVRGEQARLVELLLLQVEVFVHRLHEGAQHVDGGVADAVVTQLQRLSHLDADLEVQQNFFKIKL